MEEPEEELSTRPINMEYLYDAIPHIFLPRQTPGKEKACTLPKVEEFLLKAFHRSIFKTCGTPNGSFLSPVLNMFDKWEMLQPFSKESSDWQNFQREIRKSKPGGTFPMYLRNQNCTVVIKKEVDPSNQFEVCTYTSALPVEKVMSTACTPVLEFPETIQKIRNTGMIQSQAFAELLHELAVGSIQYLKQVEKGDHTYDETRDVAYSHLVSDWLVEVLLPDFNYSICKSRTKVRKKIRDQVALEVAAGSSKSLPFRRCGMYMSLKATLQLKLHEIMEDATLASLLYKIIMLHFLTDICAMHLEFLLEVLPTYEDIDLSSQMLAKLGTRVKKLQNSFPATTSHNVTFEGQIQKMKFQSFEYTKGIVEKLGAEISRVWNKICCPVSNRVGQPEYKVDKNHDIRGLQEYIKKLKTVTNISSQETAPAIEPIARYPSLQTISEVPSNPKLLKVWLFDAENFIKYKCNMNTIGVETLHNLLKLYVSKAETAYKGNPLGISQMLLVSLKAVQLAHAHIKSKYALIGEYKTEINLEKLNYLLLPHQTDMELLDDVVAYFGKHESEATFPGISQDNQDHNSFAARFTENNVKMQGIKARIKEKENQEIADKLEEVHRKRNECKQLQAKMSRAGTCECEFETEERVNNKGISYMVKTDVRISKCDKCKFKDELNKIRKSVSIYEKLLPKEEEQANAVVFEVGIPKDLLYWRDILAYLKHDVLNDPFTGRHSSSVKKKWANFKDINPNRQNKKIGSVFLGSTTFRVTSTCYTKTQSRDLLQDKDERFIIDTGMSCNLFYDRVGSPIKCALSSACSFQLKSTSNPKVYENLQDAVESWNHTQNEIIARQYQCSEDLTTREFIAIGSLRAGHRIQIRNLYESIYSGALSLNKEPVVALVLQTIWQVGPVDKQYQRESYMDFYDNEFSKEFLRMLENLVDTNKQNYGSPNILLCAILITRRISEFNSIMQDACYNVVKKWRKILSGWIQRCCEELANTHISNERQLYFSNILYETNICLLLSFNVGKFEDFTQVIRSPDDIVCWFNALQKWHSYVTHRTNLSEFMIILVNLIELLPLRLNLCQHEILKESIYSSLKDFWIEQWNGIRNCKVKSEEIAKETALVLRLEATDPGKAEYLVTFDMFSGEFLMNGASESQLPKMYANSTTFQRYFKGITNFRVRKGNQVYTSLEKFNGKSYIFSTKYNAIKIEEAQNDGTYLVLLDPAMANFSVTISDYFIDGYSHWLDPNTNEILFRKEGNEPTIKTPYSYKLIPNEEKWIMYDCKRNQHILSKNSKTFQDISSVYQSLEKVEHIVVSVIHEGTWQALLWRHNLSFIIKSPENHESVEYPGYCVQTYQLLDGTLIGLKNGLVVKKNKKNILITPHGDLNVTSKWQSHHETRISLEDLRSPSFFVYEVDSVLQRITAQSSKSAWLYLAALHAATASPLPDPFTQMTGTEMAMQILQSARIWPSIPYKNESLKILKYIKTLSPIRVYYGSDRTSLEKSFLENVKWPPGLSNIAAYDGYALIVDKLISDSQRLQNLFPNVSVTMEDEEPDETEQVLRHRAYFNSRNMYNPVAHIDLTTFEDIAKASPPSEIIGVGMAISPEKLKTVKEIAFGRIVFDSCYTWIEAGDFEKDSLLEFLLTDDPLEPPYPELFSQGKTSLLDLLYLDLRANWLKLYVMATSCQTTEDFTYFTMVLSLLACQGCFKEQLVNLHLICELSNSENAHHIKFPEMLPNLDSVDDPTNNQLQSSVLEDLLRKWFKPYPYAKPEKPTLALSERYKNDLAEYEKLKEEFTLNLVEQAMVLIDDIENLWPCEAISDDSITKKLGNIVTNPVRVLDIINKNLIIWHQNLMLKRFIDEVQSKLNDFASNGVPDEYMTQPIVISGNREKQTTGVVTFQDPVFHATNLIDYITKEISLEQESNDFIKTASLLSNVSFTSEEIAKKAFGNLNKDIMKTLSQLLLETDAGKIIQLTGVLPRITPISLLSDLSRSLKENFQNNETLQQCIVALAVVWTQLKRIDRCFAIDKHAPSQVEVDNPGHINWSPSDHVEWLLIELEMDIMIRPIQVDVAKQMIQMPNGGNGVTQLKMGQGKTSVIVPMLCASLAEKEEKLCRVTVLSSMFNMNLNSLTYTLGGLLNRRIYVFPCRRDMEMDETCVETIQEVYKECLDLQGVVVTLPEHRLSFRLLSHDYTGKEESRNIGLKILKVENWLRKHVRDVLDESDEILNVKYQLVYTVGEQVTIDGGDLRWTLCQQIMEIIQNVAIALLREFGETAVQFDTATNLILSHQFSHFRILDEVCVKRLNEVIAERMLINLDIPDRIAAQRFIANDAISEHEHDELLSTIENLPEERNKILLLFGYLRRGVLALALKKRWRVEYGINPKMEFRRMAVPYRAKDVAAEKTEFGHPDLAIVLTHLHYYYAGLTEIQMEEVFKRVKSLEKSEQSAGLYGSWISKIPADLVDLSLSEYASLNLKDAQQKAQVFQLLRKHKDVVNYWLSNCVFPRESKQFPGKLVLTAWDLVYEGQQYPTTGFSGTNDFSLLLPLAIQQQDLEELQRTNEELVETLLQPENGNHRALESGVTCKQILNMLKVDKIKILIDAGALMLDRTNEEIAKDWLEIDADNIEAVVYFNQNNELVVKVKAMESIRNHADTPFNTSPYKERLNKCAVFLDDEHSRGTDFKFPGGSRACVTIGSGMKRDKLMQACLRMRKLGEPNGHSVTFYLAREAYNKIKAVNPKIHLEIATQGVLNWVSENTEICKKEGLVHWAMAGRNYAQRLAAEEEFDLTGWLEEENEEYGGYEHYAQIMASQCIDKDTLDLEEMYGKFSELERLTSLIPQWFNATWDTLIAKNDNEELDFSVVEKFEEIQDKVLERCEEHAEDIYVIASSLDEQQERELELEMEVEVQEERVVVKAETFQMQNHSLHESVHDLVLNGGPIQVTNGIFPVGDIFSHTTFKESVPEIDWNKNVFATKDFLCVISKRLYNASYFKTNSHLRPVNYLVSWKLPDESFQLLILSPFEINALIPYFREGGGAKVKLHMFSARFAEGKDWLVNKTVLQLPTSLRNHEMIPVASSQAASLLLASGTMYFSCKEEQREYVKLIKLAKEITTPDGEIHLTHFDQRKVVLLRKILACRHPTLSKFTHVAKLLEDKRIMQ